MGIKVRATKVGYYGQLRQEGAVFEIKDEKDKGSWMEVLEQPKAKGGKPQPAKAEGGE